MCAKIWLEFDEDEIKTIKKAITKFCSENTEKYKVPLKLILMNEKLHNNRFKKKRIL